MTATTTSEPNPVQASAASPGSLEEIGSLHDTSEEGIEFEVPEAVPTADHSSSRKSKQDIEAVGFTLDEFASLLSKYDYNFKPGDVVNGTVFALESKGAMIDIGAKTAAFMPLQEVSINRVEHLSDVLEPGEVREFSLPCTLIFKMAN